MLFGSATVAVLEILITEIRECFDMFDIDQDGRISADEIATMTRALGQNPTDAEIIEMIDEVDKDGKEHILTD